jgi:hypothetical protein|tara:strand:+ start:248 stop:550 length:303 start_codon:yes stop_codon:yes gene_type:complete
MPTYRFYNKNTKTEFEEYMSIADMEKFTKKKHITLMPPTQMNIISGVVSASNNKDGGFNEVLHKISEAHPNSALADRTLKKSIKQVKTRETIKKHFKKNK